MYVCEKVKEQVFEARKTKEAYLEACKWVASNVIALNNSKNLGYKIEKHETKGNLKAVKLTVYVQIEEQEVYDKNCNVCRECSNLFYLKENKNLCDGCKINPYRERLKARTKAIKEGMKGKIL